MESLPNLIYIGPDKAGSTWLFGMLSHHPDVFVPAAKDLYFFDRYYDKGMPWYSRQFSGHDGQAIVAEISHDYLYSREAAKRIRDALPNTKLLVCLREPVERTFSAYLQMVKAGDFCGTFEQGLAQCPHLTEHSLYGKYVRRYLDFFPVEQIQVAMFDDLRVSPQRFTNELCDQLGIASLRLPEDVQKKALPASRSRSARLTRSVRKAGHAIRRWGMPGLVGRVKASKLVQRLLYARFDDGQKPAPTWETCQMLRDRFAEDVATFDQVMGTNCAERWGYPIAKPATAANGIEFQTRGGHPLPTVHASPT